MSDHLENSTKHIGQVALKDIQVGRDLKIRDINQKIIVQPPQPQLPSNPPSNLFNRGTLHFVGRDQKLNELHQLLQNENQPAICALTGMGGIGKTELAVHYAIKYQEEYPGGLCWLQGRGADLGTQIVNYGLSRLQLAIPDGLELIRQVELCWKEWPRGNALIVFDDVQDFQAIKPYLPPAQQQFKVLMTSRQRQGTNIQSIYLDVLSPEAALKLLNKLVVVGKERIDAELEQVKALCKWLGYLPLGLELVGRYLVQHPTLKIAQTQKRLEKRKLASRALLSQEEKDMTARLGVAAAFELSWQDLSPAAQQLGCRLSLFAPVPFNWSWVETCSIKTEDEEEREEDQEALEDLRDYFLSKYHLLQLTEDHSYRLHPLVREFFQVKLDEMAKANEYKQDFCQAMAAFAKEFPETLTQEQIGEFAPAIPHLTVATTLSKFLRDDDFCLPFVGIGKFYISQGFYQEAEPLYENCLNCSIKRFENNNMEVASSQNNLGHLYYLQGRYSEAKELFHRALKISESLPEKDDIYMATIQENLALVYDYLNCSDKAEEFVNKALKIRETHPGEEDFSLARLWHHRAFIYTNRGSKFAKNGNIYKADYCYQNAEDYYIKSLELSQGVREGNNIEVAKIKKSLAVLYGYQGMSAKAQAFRGKSQTLFRKAENLLKEVFKTEQRLLGEEHLDLADTLNNLGCLYSEMGRNEEAINRLNQALEMREKLLGKHPKVVNTLRHLADVHQHLGNYRQAILLDNEAANIQYYFSRDK